MRDRRLRGRGERGAVLIIFSVFALVSVLLLAAVVDLGNHRQELKQVTLSTDAAALAAASTIRFGTPASTGTEVDCSSVPSTEAGRTVGDIARSYWTGNGGQGPLDCKVFFDAQPNSAYVTVTATNQVDYAFSGATGQRSGSATGSSSARIASARGGLLYPVGLCTDGALQVLATQPTGLFSPPQATTVVFDTACGGAGNKRQIQFRVNQTGNSCGAVGMWCWDFNHGGYDAGPNMSPIVESDTGKDWQKAEGTINTLATNKTHIWIPVVKSRPDLGASGTFAKYEVTHFAEVQITSYSKRRGLGFLVHRIVPFAASGPLRPPRSTPPECTCAGPAKASPGAMPRRLRHRATWCRTRCSTSVICARSTASPTRRGRRFGSGPTVA